MKDSKLLITWDCFDTTPYQNGIQKNYKLAKYNDW